jgi:hypothetical protein
MTVIRVHELAKKMGVESKDLIAVLEKMGIKEKTPTSGLDDKETKSLIDKLKAVRKEKEKTKKEKPAATEAEVAVSLDERRKKAAALIGKFSSTLEKPGTRPKPAPIPPKPSMPAPPVIAPVGAEKPVELPAGGVQPAHLRAALPLSVRVSPAAEAPSPSRRSSNRRCFRRPYRFPLLLPAENHQRKNGRRRPTKRVTVTSEKNLRSRSCPISRHFPPASAFTARKNVSRPIRILPTSPSREKRSSRSRKDARSRSLPRSSARRSAIS